MEARRAARPGGILDFENAKLHCQAPHNQLHLPDPLFTLVPDFYDISDTQQLLYQFVRVGRPVTGQGFCRHSELHRHVSRQGIPDFNQE